MEKSKIDALMAAYKNVRMPDGSIITCPARLSWPSLFEPTDGQKQEGKAPDLRYRVTALFPLGADLTILREATGEAAVAKFGQEKLKTLLAIEGKFKKPLIDQALAAMKEEEKTKQKSVAYVPGAFMFRATTKRRVPVLGPDLAVISDPDQVYPGMWCRFKITVRAYDKSGGVGVSFDLAGVQKIADDDRLGGGVATNATEGFGPIAGAAPSAVSAAASNF